MFYLWQLMEEYRRAEGMAHDKPYWQIVRHYEIDDPGYKKFPNGERLFGNGNSGLTEPEAQQRAGALDAQLHNAK